MENIFLHLLKMSLTAGLLVVVVLLLRVVFCKAPRWIHCLLWALVAVRLLCPITLESSLSLMPDTNAAFSAVTEQISTPQEEPDIPVVDNAVTDTPVVNTPVTNAPAVDTPVVDTPVVDTPVVDTPVVTPTPNTPPSASVDTPTTNVAVSAPTPEAGVDPWQVAVAVASYVWLAGVVLLASYAVFTTLRLHRQVREAARLSGRVWCCDHIRSPFILGVFRPRIYLPSDLDGVARDSVIAHEQAHLHRRDHWWKPLGFLLLMVHWFNPLMWVAYILLCRDIEAACDERVVRDMTAPDRKTYSEVLLACSAPRRLVSACPLAFGETSVKSRVKSVLSYKKPTIWIIVAALLVSTVAGVCLLTDPKPEDGKPDTKVTTTPEEDDPPEEPAVAPTHAVFTHTGEPKAQITLELNGNGCTYINSILSSAMPYEGTYVQSENGFLLSFPPTTMTIELNGDFTGLTLRMGQSDTHMSYEQMSYGGKELKNGAVFARTADVRAVSYAAPLTFSSGNWLGDEQLAEMRQKYQYRTGSNDNNDRPIIPITSRAELDAFIAEYEDAFSFNKAEGDGLTPVHQMSFYDDAFFAEKMLLAVYYRDGSFMVAPQITAVEYNGAELVTVQVDVYAPALQAQVLGQWFMLAEVPLDEIPYATAYRAVIRDRIPADYRWATYSHPVTVGDEGDVAVGYYSIFDYGRETLMSLVEGLEWYGADIMADTDFTYLGYFTIDGQKKYYVSPDKKQLYDGEQIADLTAEQSEQLDFYLRDGNPGEDAIAASVTGTVTEWSKEGDYIMLEVTEGDSKLGPRVMAYTTILMPGSAPAVGYPATIYYDGWCDGRGFGSAIYAIHREWQDADLLGGPDEPDEPTEKWLNYTVIVRGEIGNPLSGVKINISSENIAETITTDSTGVAKARLPEGVPTGTIEVPQGYVAASEKFTFAAGSTTLTIVLEKEQPVTPPTSTDLSTASVSFVKFSRPISGPSAATYSATRYMYPVVPDSTTCDFLRQLAMRTDWVKKDTYFGDYDAYFTIGDDKNYYYIDRVNGTIHHNRWFLPLSDEEVSKLDTLIRSYGIQNNSKITATVTDWRYLTGRVQECVEGQNGYVTLKLDPWWANIYGEKMKVSTRFIPYRYFANGSMVCVVYDGEAEQSAETGPLTIYAGSIDTLTETGIVSTGIPQYDNLLKQIQDYFYKRTTVRPDCSSAVWNCEALSDIGIKLIDLDNNGQDELVIGATNSTFWVGYSDVYTIQNGQLVQLFRSTDNNLYSIHKGGYVCQEWTENTLWFGEDYYHVEGGQLVFCEGLMFSVNYASSLGYVRTDAWFRVTLQDGKNVYEHITEDEANAIAEKYGKNDLSYTLYVIPFSL